MTTASICPSGSLAIPFNSSSGIKRQLLPTEQLGPAGDIGKLRMMLKNGSRRPLAETSLGFVSEAPAGFLPPAVFCGTIFTWFFFSAVTGLVEAGLVAFTATDGFLGVKGAFCAGLTVSTGVFCGEFDFVPAALLPVEVAPPLGTISFTAGA